LTGEVVLGVAEHISVLRFSTKWGFKKVRASTIRDFPAMDVVDKIVLAREHRIEEWLMPSLDAYARLGRSITMADVERLGPEYIRKIISVRDGMRRPAAIPCGDTQICWTENLCRIMCDFTEPLRNLFAEEIKPLDIQHPPMTPSDLEEYYLSEIYFLVSKKFMIPLLPKPQPCLAGGKLPFPIIPSTFRGVACVSGDVLPPCPRRRAAGWEHQVSAAPLGRNQAI
jgi:hypothetical protein